MSFQFMMWKIWLSFRAIVSSSEDLVKQTITIRMRHDYKDSADCLRLQKKDLTHNVISDREWRKQYLVSITHVHKHSKLQDNPG